MKWLVEEGKAEVDKADNNGRTSLFIASQIIGYLKVVKDVVEVGKAEVDKTDNFGQTSL